MPQIVWENVSAMVGKMGGPTENLNLETIRGLVEMVELPEDLLDTLAYCKAKPHHRIASKLAGDLGKQILTTNKALG